MHSYELTDRGKIVICIILVVIILVLPAAILAYKAWAQPSQAPENSGSEGSGSMPPTSTDTPPPIIAESPPPNGGGFNPPDIFPPVSSGDPGASDQTPPPVSGQPSIDPAGGTLSFFFSPRLQDTLDPATASLLSAFLNSPKNTSDSLIAVEIPRLPDEDSEKIISAVISAFTALEVTEQKLAFITVSAEFEEDPFQVVLSFIIQRAK